MEPEESFSSLLSCYGLIEESCNQPVLSDHLDDISRLCHKYWRKLPAHLGYKPGIMISDIDYMHSNEAKAYRFLVKWKEIMGSEATYSRLIKALLNIDCRLDAEKVCAMLKDLPDIPAVLSIKGI